MLPRSPETYLELNQWFITHCNRKKAHYGQWGRVGETVKVWPRAFRHEAPGHESGDFGRSEGRFKEARVPSKLDAVEKGRQFSVCVFK